MKIAVATVNTLVAQHFGHCESFMIFDVEDGHITQSNTIPNPGHKPGFLPNYLYELGVNIIISGGMGGGAVEIFNERKIQVITGASGDAQAVVEGFLSGKVQSTGSICDAHEHAHECH